MMYVRVLFRFIIVAVGFVFVVSHKFLFPKFFKISFWFRV